MPKKNINLNFSKLALFKGPAVPFVLKTPPKNWRPLLSFNRFWECGEALNERFSKSIIIFDEFLLILGISENDVEGVFEEKFVGIILRPVLFVSNKGGEVCGIGNGFVETLTFNGLFVVSVIFIGCCFINCCCWKLMIEFLTKLNFYK